MTKSKTAIKATVGAAYLSGNSLCPRTDTVLAIVSWDRVPAKEKKAWRTIEYWMTEEQLAAREYVMYRDRRIQSAPRDVFEATRYETHAAMVEAYAA